MSARIEIGDSVIYQKLQDEVVILNMKDQNYYGLDEVGASMWQLLLEYGGDVDSVVRELKNIYDADEDTLRRDLSALIQEMLKADLLKTGNLGSKA